MKRILVTGAGGSASTNFIRSLRKSVDDFYIIGTDANQYYLQRAEADKRYLVPPVSEPDFLVILNKIIKKERIEFVHCQSDVEVACLSENRENIKTRIFLPSKQTVRICRDKYLSYQKWKRAGLKVPETFLIKNLADLKRAFVRFPSGVWLRFTTGAGGRGSLPTTDFSTAVSWIDFHQGWGQFTAAELLEPQSITWMSIWHEGRLVVAQGRKRLYWELSKISPSGITGVTGAGLTIRDSLLDKIALQATLAIDPKPHGLFGVDLTYDHRGIPNPTEINIGRFFTTHLFFTEAGLNLPEIFVKLAYGERLPPIKIKINPLRPGLVWIRGVDFQPVLTNLKTVRRSESDLKKMLGHRK